MKCLIWSNEHWGWWRPDRCGYTNHKSLAGVYTIEEATEIVEQANKHINWEKLPDEPTPVPNESIVPLV